VSQNNEDPIEFVKRLAESYRQIRLGRGVVGKTGHATLGLLAVWGIIVLRLSDNIWLDAALLASGIIVTLIYKWWVNGTQKYAKENPGLALLEGAELIEYQKFEAQAKGLPNPESTPLISDPKMIVGPVEDVSGPDK